MKLLIDTNVVLDVLQKREPFYTDACKIWTLCESDAVDGYISALTFANIVYVMRRELNPDMIINILGRLALVFNLTGLVVADISFAAMMKWRDFEDAMQAATAVRLEADYIITRNVRDFDQSTIDALTPTEFLERFDGTTNTPNDDSETEEESATTDPESTST